MSSTFSQAGVARVESVIKLIAQTCVDNEKYFSDLDAVVGDGDFGYSLARGFENVIAEWDEYDRSDLSTFIQKVATTMSGRIGGSSGPIWGTAFLRAAISVKDKNDISQADVVAMLRSAVEGIMKRGGASLGDKTLLDALVPLTDAIEADLDKGLDGKAVAQHAAEVARAAAEETAKLEAHRGRASYTGERSIGSPDPGAIAMAVLAERVAETW
ncbi:MULTISPECIES: dihydroxyacetone kinase subunit DhaL [Tessaracoccus]|jgi:dihydroxyacetone kinase-like protein|uniref:Dihydroxyacetone kinase subunit L n=1 Tax=Tessaracoccus lapidicaptus TaxID=1427523 RepID=A0A1C0APS7_9ACTN|nr:MULTISPECIES: dihydroxyacetone kinase subunit DhaL [Tessaracoccus]AQX16392.1 dihydroxyacetone kinase subunit L [Tessaracoccus sp. T2.5-30]OCL36297.1 dihydroxyacetone kinase subunit L [Tessaracoccus lapidicaptus]VEP41029.1 PEP-dependent dihydroxyacetone kinase, ADP-binding subunit DhaL [Tessaracoccus lapidicaptus]HNV76784.1 dihydroxyacetone kinase subunit DhaL [Gemmatimonadaceae bacterium]